MHELLLAVLLATASGTAVGPHHVGCDMTEMSGVHIHAQLSILAFGKPVAVPAQIGFVTVAGTPICLYWLHTHDDSGLIHVEAPGGTYTLADFFAVWGLQLSSTQLGPYHGRVTATVDGKPYAGAPQNVPILDGERIELLVRRP
jgi:hypothetical protein